MSDRQIELDKELERLRDSEVKYRLLAEESADIIYRLDIESEKYVYVSPSGEKTFGYTAEESLALRIQDTLTPQSYALQREKMFQAFARGQQDSEVLELESVHKDGHIIPVEVHSRFLLDAGGNPVGIIGVARDITERKRAEQRYRDLFESSKDGIIHVDLQGRIQNANTALVEMVGYSKEELQQLTYQQLTPPKWRDKEDEIVRSQIVLRGYSDEYEKEYVRKDGGIFPIALRAWLMKDERGRPSGMWAIIRDISERKQVEEERRQLERQRQQIQKSESLERMAAAIAHHFNNLLGAVMGNLELLMEDLPQGVMSRTNATEAMRACRRAAEVSDLMLTYLGQMIAEYEPLDLAEACSSGLSLVKVSIQKNVALKADFPSPGPLVRSNANQIEQVLRHLLANASEAVDERSGVIAVTVKTVSPADIPAVHRFPIEWRTQENSYACLEVKDNGCGMAGKDIEQIFDPFFSSKLSGRGLGLPVVLGIVRAHGGVIAVESAPDQGSVFRVFLPSITQGASLRPDKAAVSNLEREPGHTVLLVDDEEMVRSMAKSLLKRLDYEVLEAKDGIEAVEVFQKHQSEIGLVLLDLTMPRMNGWETLTALRQFQLDLPVILVSGYDEARVMQAHNPEAAQAFLHKPYGLAELKAALAKIS